MTDIHDADADYSAQVDALRHSGLTAAEARLVLQHRQAQPFAMGRITDDAETVALVMPTSHGIYSDPVVSSETAETVRRPRWQSLAVALGLALISALLVYLQIRRLFEGNAEDNEYQIFGNLFLITLPFVLGYVIWLRQVPLKITLFLLAAVVALALAVNLYPWAWDVPGASWNLLSQSTTYISGVSQTGTLAVLHLPVVLWLLIGLAYIWPKAGGVAWRSAASRMEFIRFSGEWLIFLLMTFIAGNTINGLIATSLIISRVQVQGFGISIWLSILLPAWLFLSTWLTFEFRSVVARVLPVLTWVFTPLMVLALLVVFVVLAGTGSLTGVSRELLILLDVMLIVVLALTLYAVSARNPAEPPKAFDWVQLVMIAIAVVMNVIALIWMVIRLAEFGWTPNRAAVLGLNLLLMVHLVWTGWLLLRFILQGRTNLAATEPITSSAPLFNKVVNWQTNYLPVYLIWSAIVVFVFPVMFQFR